jgi:DNA-binding SARP family transcriptional activator/Tfp pilus assembly protein PilF
MEFRVLGPVRATHGDQEIPLGRRRERLVLGLLVLNHGHLVPAERLADIVWGGDPPDSARTELKVAVSRLRGCFKDTSQVTIHFDRYGYRLDLADATVDAHAFTAEVELALATEDLDARLDLLRRALDRWHGPVLADVADDAVRARIGAELDQLRLRALAARFDAELDRHGPDRVIPELTGAVAADPDDEWLVVVLMRALLAAGQIAEALRAYHRLADHLAEQMGVDPGPEARRLFEEILRADGQEAPPPRPQLLPRAPGHFTGRSAQLAALDTIAAGRAGGPIAVLSAITGTAGVGKTALAVVWGRATGDRFPDGRLYVNLRGHGATAPLSGYAALCLLLPEMGVPAAEMPMDEESAIGRFRSLTQDAAMLVILDDAHSAAQVRPLLPAGPRCMTVVTSRDRLAGLVAMDGAQRVAVEALDHAEAVALLVSMIGPARAADIAAVDRLAAACGRLPLALRIAAAALIDAPDVTVAEHVAAYSATDRLSRLVVDGDPDNSVRTAFSHSYRRLPAAVQRMFRLLGRVPGTDIGSPAAAALAGCSDAAAVSLLDRLCAMHLLNETAPGRYAFHDLIRDYARELSVAEPAGVDAAVDRLVIWYVAQAQDAQLRIGGPSLPAVTPAETWIGLSWFAVEGHNVLDLIRGTGSDRPYACAQLAFHSDYWLARQRPAGERIEIHTIGLRAAKATGDGLHESRALIALAGALCIARRLEEAVPYFQRGLDMLRGSTEHRRIMVALCNLGASLGELRRFDESVAYLEEALDLVDREESLANYLPTILGNIGFTYANSGRPERSIPYYRRSLALAYRNKEEVMITNSAQNLADALSMTGAHEEAVTLYRTALAHATAGGYELNQARAHTGLGLAMCHAGEVAAARAHLEQAVEALGDKPQPGLDKLRERLRELESRPV